MITLMLSLVLAQDADVQRIVDAYQAARPDDRELRVFQLDWGPGLQEAMDRAAKEQRPIFFVSTTQREDAGSLYTGHC